MPALTKALRKLSTAIPLWSPQLKAPPSLKVLKQQTLQPAVVYFPTCISRVMGSDGRKNIMDTFLRVSSKAGIGVRIPDDILGSCCGQIYSSKGFQDAYRHTAVKIVQQLWQVTQQGQLPVVLDVSSCVYTLKHIRAALPPDIQLQYDQLRILDSVDYLHDMILPAVTANRQKERIVLHPVCSLKKLGTEDKFLRIAQRFAKQVTVPQSAGCCGMAGDRGFLFPELTQSATAAEASEVCGSHYNGHYATTRTCEMAMSAATKANYESILYLADEMMEG